MPTFEEKLRTALRDDLQEISQEALRHPTLPVPRQTHGAAIGVAATVAAVAMVAAGMVAVMTNRAPSADISANVPGAVSPTTTAVTVTPGAIEVQGAVIPIPQGWRSEDLTESGNTAYRFCLLPGAQKLNAKGCLSSGGIQIRVAGVNAGNHTVPLPGTFEVQCGEPEGKAEVVPTLEQGSIGTEPADRITVTCTPTSTSSTYWQLSDRTFMIQTPFDDSTGLETAAWLVQRIDLHQWLHISNLSVNTAGSSTGR